MLFLVLLCAYICIGLCDAQFEDEEEIYYGSQFTWRVPREADQLVFFPGTYRLNSEVLWRRSNSTSDEGGRRRMEGRRWVIDKVTQGDQGLYELRRTNGRLIQARRLTVSAYVKYLNRMLGDDVTITFTLPRDMCTVYFTPKDLWSHVAISGGDLVTNYFEERADLTDGGKSEFKMSIYGLKKSDVGAFSLKDSEDNLAMMAHLDVEEPDIMSLPISHYVGIAVGISAVVLICCCCMRKCCCKKSSNKTTSPDVAQTAAAAAPDVYYHGLQRPAQTPAYTNRPAGSAQPSGYSFPALLVHNPTDVNVTSLQPEVPATGGQGGAPTGPIDPIGSTGPISYDYFATDCGPRYEMKGLASAPPLSADTSICDVYTSSKLNFL